MAKAALTLMPICTVLSMTSCDQRASNVVRERACHALQLFKPRFCMCLGLAADFGLVCQRFLRIFDQGDHDIARSEAALRSFADELKALFLDGWIFSTHRKAGTTAIPIAGGVGCR